MGYGPAHRIEEEQISGLQVLRIHTLAELTDLDRPARQLEPGDIMEHESHEATAIEPRFRIVPATSIGHANQGQRALDDARSPFRERLAELAGRLRHLQKQRGIEWTATRRRSREILGGASAQIKLDLKGQ
jgi:hypothetical protein